MISDKLKSRKLWLALLGAILPIIAQVLTQEVGWQEAVMSSVAIVMSYIFGQGYVDGQKAGTDKALKESTDEQR
jgi:uncharacterized membrane protein